MKRMNPTEKFDGFQQIWRSDGKNTNLLSLRSDVKRKGFVFVETIFMCVVCSNVLTATAANCSTSLTAQAVHIALHGSESFEVMNSNWKKTIR